jgi:hypothetical protein
MELDHIASEIEQTDDKKLQFEDALQSSKLEGNGLHTNCWMVGGKSVPKIIIQKSLQMIKRIF